MISFLKLLLPLLDRGTRLRLCAATAAMVVLAALEGAGVACIAPLLLLVNRASTPGRPGPPDQWMIDLFGVRTALAAASALALIAFSAFLVKGIFAVLLLRWNLGVILQAEAKMSRRLLEVYLRAPHAFRLRRPTSDLQRNVHEAVRQVYEGAMAGLVGAGADALVIALVGAILLVLQPDVALLGILYFGVIGIAYQRLIQRPAREAGAHVLEGWDRSFKLVQQSLRSAKVLALSRRHDVFVEGLYDAKLAMASRLRTVMLLFQLPRYYLETSLIVGVALISALLFTRREVSEAFAGLGLFLAAGFRLLPSINRLLIAAGSARSSEAALRGIAEDLRSLEAPHEEERPPLGPTTVELRDVSFTHEGATAPSIRNVSLRIDPGTLLGVAGASGAGKTTLVDLLLGLLDPTAGTVEVGGRPLPEVRSSWQRSIGYVPQEVVLTEATLAENIALGYRREEIEVSQLSRAIAMAQLEPFVEELPLGIDTMVGEEGSSVSGGQRQRLGIARAVYDRATTLVLDEATSALDAATEALVMAAVLELRRSMTIIVIAHRLSTLRTMDRILLLDAGALADSGTFEELTERSATFRALAHGTH